MSYRDSIVTDLWGFQAFFLVLNGTAVKNEFDFQKSILANANAGGDNVHRGMISGLIAGAASDEIPQDLKEGLAEYEGLEKEINAFVDSWNI